MMTYRPLLINSARRWLLAVAALLALLAGFPARAQQKRSDANASVHGTITTKKESASASVSGITVKLTGEAIGGSGITVDTDDAGLYEFKNLKPGAYTLSIAQSGFKAVTRAVTLPPA